ncbi:DNA-binding protein [Pseudomonas sp. A46]|nr:PLP-dependent aminotransferase family protein [Pseudomonas sp. A46]OWJ98242.1 DNA-binding protein [Pseudomonas sp. A46]
MARTALIVDLPSIGTIDRSAGQLARQLAAVLRDAVRKGELKPGELLPSSRALAQSLTLSRGTVTEAFDQLIAEGVLESQSRAGTRVSNALSAQSGQNGLSLEDAAPVEMPLPPSAEAYAKVNAEFTALPHRPFAISVPVGLALPDDAWQRLGNRLRSRGDARPSGYGEPQGALVLREAIADYLRRSRSVKCTAEQIIITSGAQQALFVCSQILLSPGDSVWVEDPAYRGLTAILENSARDPRIIRVPVDSEGMSIDAGISLAAQARVAFVTPSHQYPLGMPMSMARRNALLAWAKSQRAWVVEDDYDSELRYAGHPFPSLQGLDPARVIYLGTFSKILFPSLRLGYAVVPKGLEAVFCGARILMDRHPPSAEQHVLAAFMSEGHLDRHIRRIRSVYSERRNQLVDVLTDLIHPHLGWLQPSDQGMHVVLWLAEGLDDRAIAAAALAAGVSVRPVSSTYSSGKARPGLILGIGDYDFKLIEQAARQLAGLIDSFSKSPIEKRAL